MSEDNAMLFYARNGFEFIQADTYTKEEEAAATNDDAILNKNVLEYLPDDLKQKIISDDMESKLEPGCSIFFVTNAQKDNPMCLMKSSCKVIDCHERNWPVKFRYILNDDVVQSRIPNRKVSKSTTSVSSSKKEQDIGTTQVSPEKKMAIVTQDDEHGLDKEPAVVDDATVASSSSGEEWDEDGHEDKNDKNDVKSVGSASSASQSSKQKIPNVDINASSSEE